MSNLVGYDTLLFTEVWDEASKFKTDFQASPFAGCLHYGETVGGTTYPDNVTLIYYLLYAKYGNNPIANFDINQFKYKVYSVMFSYGPAWEKRVEIQDKLRKLTEADILAGSKAIRNSALNPSDAPGTGTLEELGYINAQNTTNYKRGKLEGYSLLWDLLATDVTTEFVSKFNVCFSKMVRPEKPILYTTEEDSDDE